MIIENVKTQDRLYEENNEIKLCEHITLIGKQMKDDDGCEYVEIILIRCEICKCVHEINVLIN